jgi:hypothetical protein
VWRAGDGGNYSGFQEVSGLERPGFPLAEISADGSSVITKHPETGGAVTIGTVTAQLLYEIQGLDYLNPDVTLQLDSLHLSQDGPDRVRISGARGTPPPPDTKVAVTLPGGFRNEVTFVLTGLDVDAKAALVERTIRSRFEGRDGLDTLEFQRIGQPAGDADRQADASCLLRVVAIGSDERAVGRPFSSGCIELALASYPGLFTTTIPGGATRFARYWPGRIPQATLDHTVIAADGTRTAIEAPKVTASPRPAGTARAGGSSPPRPPIRRR